MGVFFLVEGQVEIIGKGASAGDPLHVQVENASAFVASQISSGDGSGHVANINASKELLVRDAGAISAIGADLKVHLESGPGSVVGTPLFAQVTNPYDGQIVGGNNTANRVNVTAGFALKVDDSQLATTNSSLGTINTNMATAANQATTNTKLDGLQITLTAIDGRVDGLEGLVTSTNNALGTEATTLNVALPAGAAGVMGHLSALWNLANDPSPANGLKIKLDGTPITNYAHPSGGVGAMGVLTAIKSGQKDYRLNPDQIPIRRRGTITTAATAPTLITGATTAVTGYPANTAARVEYTVPTDRVYRMEVIALSMHDPAAGKHVQLDVDIIDGSNALVERFTLSLYTSSVLSDSIQFRKPVDVPAGYRVEMRVHTSGNTAMSYVATHAGIEEAA